MRNPDLFFSRPFMKRHMSGGGTEWVPVVLVLRSGRLILNSDFDTHFDVEAASVSAYFSRWVIMRLTVDGVTYDFSNLPTADSPAISPRLGQLAQRLRDEQLRTWGVRRVPKEWTGSLSAWRNHLDAAGAEVSGTRGRSESVLVGVSSWVAVVGITAIAVVLLYLAIAAN